MGTDAKDSTDWNRREFLRNAGLVGAGLAMNSAFLQASAQADAHTAETKQPNANEIPRKKLGRTGEMVSAIGLGGFHIGATKDEQEGIQIIQEAVDAGINFLDNAWEYNDGISEERMGKALKGRRDKVILMTKVCTHGRGKDVAMQMLEESLRRLQTDHLDVWQIHEVIHDNDPDLIFAKGGAIEALTQAKQQGKVRFVGFTGHKDPSIHLKMLAHNYPFDTVQMPLNCFDATFRSFAQQVLPVLNRQGIAPLGMKSLSGSGESVIKGAVTPQEALRYAMSLPVATTISGMDSLEVLYQNLNIARGFTPMTESEMEALRERCRQYASDGRFELYKTTKKYDAKIGREQHHFPPPEELPL